MTDSLPYNNQNDVKEYAFGSGSAGSLVRETTTTFVTSSTYTGTNVHLRSLPSQTSVLDANASKERGQLMSTTLQRPIRTMRVLVNRLNISGFDSSFTTS